jgi:hypothetical protein
MPSKMHLLSTRYKLSNKTDLITAKHQLRLGSRLLNNVQQSTSQSAGFDSELMRSEYCFEDPPAFPNNDTWSRLDNCNGQKYELIKHYLENINWSTPYLILPNICFSQINEERFYPLMNGERSFVRLINRSELVDGLVYDYKNDFYNSYYLLDLPGCGKSFIIYQIACKLMCSDKNVVIYVNQTSETTIADIMIMLKTRYFH